MKIDAWLLEILACPALQRAAARRRGGAASWSAPALRPGLPGPGRHPGPAGRRGAQAVTPAGEPPDDAVLDDPDALAAARPGRDAARGRLRRRPGARRAALRARPTCRARSPRTAGRARRGRGHGRLRHRRRRARRGGRAGAARCRSCPPRPPAARLGRRAGPGVAVSCSGEHRGDAGRGRRGRRRGCRLLASARAGSPLAERAAGGRAVHLPVDASGRQPRATCGLACRPAGRWPPLGLADVPRGTLGTSPTQLEDIAERCRPASDAVRQPGKRWPWSWPDAADVWGTTPSPRSRRDRFACQLAENAKYPAVVRRAPRGPATTRSWCIAGAFGALAATTTTSSATGEDAPARPRLRLVLLRDAEEHPRGRAARARRRARLAEQHGVPCTELRAEGEHPLERLASLIGALDFASVYLALRPGHRPRARSSRSSPSRPTAATRRCRVSAGGGTRAIIAALLANLGIAVTKFVAFLLTGVVVDARRVDPLGRRLGQPGAAAARRQAGPARAGRRSTRSATAASATSTRSSSSVVLFSVGGLFSLYEGWHKIQHPQPIDAWQWVPIVVLIVAIVLESFSFRTAIQESNQVRGDAVVGAVHPPRQGARAAGRPAGGPRRAARPGLRAVRRGADADHRRRRLGRHRHVVIGVLLVVRRGRPGDRDQEPAARRGRDARRPWSRIEAALVADDRGRPGHPHAHAAPRPGGAAGRRQDRGRATTTRAAEVGPRHRRGRARGSARPCRSPG